MNLIVKSTQEWINLITKLREIKTKFGHSIIDQTIFLLEQMQNNRLVSVGQKVMLLDVLVEQGIDNISFIIQLLNKLKNIYDLASVLRKIEEIEDKYGVNYIAFMLDQDSIRVVDTYYTNHGFKECYLPLGVIPKVEIDLKKNMSVINSFMDSEFITHEQDFRLREDKRIYYTSDFRFGSMSFPSKQEMDFVNLSVLKKKWVDTLFKSLTAVPQDCIFLEVTDSNRQKMHLSNQFDYYEIIQTDGEILDSLGGTLTSFYQNITVSNADVVMISKIEKCEVKQIMFTIHPTYFKKYIQELETSQDKYLLDIIYQLLDHKKGNILYRR